MLVVGVVQLRIMRRLLGCLLLACLAPLGAGADGFHGAMNAEQLSHQWNQNKYAAFVRGGDYNSQLGGNIQNLLNHMKYLSRTNVLPREFPNFKDKDIPGVKSQAMAILKEMGKAAAPTVVNNLVKELEGRANQNLMGMTPNKDYAFNLKLILEDLGRDAVAELQNAIRRSNGKVREELQHILDRILKKEKNLKADLGLKGDAQLSAEIQRAVQRGVRLLLAEQGPNGSWAHHPGYTALGLLTLLKAGFDPGRPECRRAAGFLATASSNRTYDVALTAMALAELDPNKYQPVLKKCAEWFEKKQLSNGMWNYRFPGGAPARAGRFVPVSQARDGDNSNTQLALLGLLAAGKAGIQVRNQVLERARKHLEDGQNTDGGWGYGSSRGQTTSYGSMTAAGVAGLMLLGNVLHVPTEKCGVYAENDRIQRGLDWLKLSWSVSVNPKARGGKAEPYYYLYALERIAVFAGMKYIGGRDWYREGATFLVRDQKADGSWGRRIYGLSDTCFAVLFLAKGPTPLLVNKLRWDRKKIIHRFDSRHMSEAAGPLLRQRLSHQILHKSAPLSQYLKAPLLFINGHTAPQFTASEREKIRSFTRLGGIVFAEACCASAEFDEGFRSELAAIFPEKRLLPLPSNHPVYTLHHKIRAPAERFLEGFVGCRSSVIYSPKGFSCAVDLGNDLGDIGFRLSSNVALYATGNQRLTDERQVDLRLLDDPEPAAARAERGALLMAQVKYEGDWNPDPGVIPNLLRHLREKARVRVAFKKDAVTLASPNLFEYSALFLTGHAAVSVGDAEAKNLRAYLRKGGVLIAESCCGNSAFDASFRRLMGRVFPESALSVLPLDHRVFSFGGDPGTIRYKKTVIRENPELRGPLLEGVSVDGYTAVFYSRFALGCSIEDHACGNCRGYTRAGALDLMKRMVLYGLTE